ncbi:hypothetical protein [uncultured Flavonifractor sp.]|uniref:Mu-like prophage tail protein gpP n=1 Tax=Candidatus Flavonifractor intestinigallinarum TaxID=2838586 RepID=A0A9D2MM70_9FIRM|nr:hypothetical protein [uncultured Flavonifractor sp.]HJB80767.1 hypothetical protein [Candidatus Flavonifractor intestinigallinarum]
MEAVLHGWDGSQIALPQVIQWKFQYGLGTPCDSFEVRCLWEPEEDLLAEAVGFTADEEGQRVFTGLVDECERGWDEQGSFLTISGRGMAARLLDNEALGMDYQVATWQDILRDHVTPYGIEAAAGAKLIAVPGFSVAVGSSEWQVVYEFCRYYGGITPRFDRLGRLVVTPWETGEKLVLSEDTGVTALTLRDQRYGVLSQILVRDRTTGAVQTVENEDFARRGGRCRRVLTMPGKSSYQTMRYSGSYQLERSAEELRQLELELLGAFAAWPGELVEVHLNKPVGRGTWRVAEMVSGMDENGTYTRLVLGDPAALK